jgi:Protein of unknown function (DUF3040).
VLSERERHVLSRIERHLVESDPDLVRLFARAMNHGSDSSAPTFLLVIGLALLVLGSLTTAVPIALIGIGLSLFSLITAHARPSRLGRPSIA